ncbi:hypothetical protein A7U60_g7764 [Sanghuangporus baumii]|uniref:Uncharacterized protein n=1 Tax=Sanghuangporus baumii TaxID=108892 RepID=A0A9Q5HSN5_SANBA|nr:hypothetical protein A7U60_g7764 [Sanghuangporus baumii]
MAWSASYGADLIFVTLALAITTLLYDELGLAAQPIGKNICCIFGYTSFEFGATKLVGPSRHLDVVSLSAITISGVLIFTTIQAQDFADVEGDIALGRVTFPIFAPEFSRSFTALIVPIWSAILGWYWDIGAGTQFALILLGGYVGWRMFTKRSSEDDKRSYVMYNRDKLSQTMSRVYEQPSGNVKQVPSSQYRYRFLNHGHMIRQSALEEQWQKDLPGASAFLSVRLELSIKFF